MARDAAIEAGKRTETMEMQVEGLRALLAQSRVDALNAQDRDDENAPQRVRELEASVAEASAAEARNDADLLRAENDGLRRDIDGLQSDPAARPAARPSTFLPDHCIRPGGGRAH